MNELRGRYVNVVLGIEEGKGMEFVKNPLHILANFNGRILESDPAAPEDSPVFNTQLVWEIEKKDLRKIRCTNSPLKVECYTTDSNERKERIGFILLSLRSAHILPKSKAKQEPPFKWEKLMGVSHEHKNCHAELYLSLTIRDTLNVTSSGDIHNVSQPLIAENVTECPLDNSNSTEFLSTIPITYLDGGYIQVGNSKENFNPFTLTLTVKIASNLDVLLPEAFVFNQAKEKYYISFCLFGITIKSKAFTRNLHDNIVLNEKIVISLLSDFETLKEFFTQHHQILVNFHGGENKLGMTKINVEKLLSHMTKEEFQGDHEYSVKCEETCNFKYPSPNGIIPQSMNGRVPFIEVVTTLEQKNLKNTKDDCGESVEKVKTVTSSLEKIAVDASGDAESADINKMHVRFNKKSRKKAQSNVEVSPKRETQKTTKSSENVLKNIPYVSPRELPSIDSPKSADGSQPELITYRKFCLNIILEKIAWRKNIKAKEFHIRFMHPKTVSTLLIPQQIGDYTQEDSPLHDARCKLFFISTPARIKRLVCYWTPKIVLEDAKNQRITNKVDVPTEQLILNGRKQYSHKLVLESSATREALADVYFTIYLRDFDETDLKEAQYDLFPEISDEEIVVEGIQELEEWKEKEKEKFKEEQELQKQQFFDKLQEDWKQKKDVLESKLTRNVKKCKVLINKLKIATNSVRIRQALEKRKMEQNKNFEDKVDKSISIYSGFEYRQLVEKICRLEQENSNLQEIIREQTEEIQAMKKSALTKEQTSSLLQELRVLEEQFEDAQRQKSYFKEQWKKAVDEIHELRTEDQKQILSQIQMNREELSQLSLDGLDDFDMENLSDGEATLRNY